MEPATKRVLVHFRGRTRPVEFAASQSDSESDSEVLLKEIAKTFSDQFSRGEDANPEVFLQIQDEEWSGEYVDVGNSQPIPNKSVIRMVVQVRCVYAVPFDCLAQHVHTCTCMVPSVCAC